MLSPEQARVLPVTEKVKTDVVVVGGGTAGWVAASCAARTGAATILLEASHCLGGMHTAGMVLGAGSMRTFQRDEWATMSTRTDGELTAGGFVAEFADRLRAEGGAFGSPGQYTGQIFQDDEMAKYVIEQMTLEAGVDIWYGSQFVDAIAEGNKLVGVLVASKSGLQIVWCKVGIDASGDGDLAARAGARWEIGRSKDGKPEAVSLYFILGDYALDRTLEYVRSNPTEVSEWQRQLWGGMMGMALEEIEKRVRREEPWRFPSGCFPSLRAKALAKGEFPIPYGSPVSSPEVGGWRSTFRSGRSINDQVAFNVDMGYGVDSTDRRQLTNAMIGLRQHAVQLSRFYRKYIPGFENSYLAKTATLPGIRETRRIIGDYVLTRDDVVNSHTFDDAIGRSGMFLDVHPEAIGETNEERGNPGSPMEPIGPRGWVHIPYRCMLPKGVDGVLLAGRCVSADHWAHGTVRWQIPSMVMGHAAGVAAAIAAKDNVSVRDLKIEKLQALLKSQGAII